jgi:hypothetical protein
MQTQLSSSKSVLPGAAVGEDLAPLIRLWLLDGEASWPIASARANKAGMDAFCAYRERRRRPSFDEVLVKSYLRQVRCASQGRQSPAEHLWILKSFCAWTVAHGYVASDPTRRLAAPKLAAGPDLSTNAATHPALRWQSVTISAVDRARLERLREESSKAQGKRAARAPRPANGRAPRKS